MKTWCKKELVISVLMSVQITLLPRD